MPQLRRAPWRASLVAFLLSLVVSERADGWESRSEPSSEPRKRSAPQAQPDTDDDDDDDDDDDEPNEDTLLVRGGLELARTEFGSHYTIDYETDAHKAQLSGHAPETTTFSRGFRLEVGGVLARWNGALALIPKGTLSYGWLGTTTTRDSALGQDYSFATRVRNLSFGTGFEFQFLRRHVVVAPELGFSATSGRHYEINPRGAQVSGSEGGFYARIATGYRHRLSRSFVVGALLHFQYLVIYRQGIQGERVSSGGTLFVEWDAFRAGEGSP